MKNINKLTIGVAALMAIPSAFSADFSKTTFELGYMGFSDTTKEDNPGALDQPFIALNHLIIKDDYSFFQLLKFENIGEVKSDKRVATKALTVFHHNLGKSKFQFWGQNFLVAHRDITEDNFYFGVKHATQVGTVKLRYGAGLHYTISSSDFNGLDYAGMSGGVANFNASYRGSLFDTPTSFSFDYITQFARDEKHAAIFNYDKDYGHQIIAAMTNELTKSIYTKFSARHYKSWGCTPNDGIEYGVAIGYRF